MASNYTENYGLCQWEATDQVVHTEFNEDNQKVDTVLGTLAEQVGTKAEQALVDVLSLTVAQKADQNALSAEISARAAGDAALQKKAGMQLIRRVTVSQSQERARLDLSDIDWSEWATVHILFKPILDNNDAYHITIGTDNSRTLSSQITSHSLLLLHPTFDAEMNVCGLYWPLTQGTQTISMDSAFRSLQYVEFSAMQNAILSGTVMEVWGSK